MKSININDEASNNNNNNKQTINNLFPHISNHGSAITQLLNDLSQWRLLYKLQPPMGWFNVGSGFRGHGEGGGNADTAGAMLTPRGQLPCCHTLRAGS